MSDYKQTLDAAGKVTTQYDKMLRSLDDDLVQAAVAAERERIISVYRKLSTGAGDGGTLVVQYVDPEQFAAAIREGGE